MEILGILEDQTPKATTSIKLSQTHQAQRDCFCCAPWAFSLYLSSNPSHSTLNYGHCSVHLVSHEVKLLEDNSWTLSIFASLSTQKRINAQVMTDTLNWRDLNWNTWGSVSLIWKLLSCSYYYLLKTGWFLCICRHELENHVRSDSEEHGLVSSLLLWNLGCKKDSAQLCFICTISQLLILSMPSQTHASIGQFFWQNEFLLCPYPSCLLSIPYPLKRELKEAVTEQYWW